MKTDTTLKKTVLTILRMAVGWHLLYEGMSKLFTSGWTAESFLLNAHGPLAGFYHFLASPGMIHIVDLFNIYGLILIGLGLFLGWRVRIVSIAGCALLTLYYFAYPPFGSSILNNPDGQVFIINRIFIEVAVLFYFILVRSSGYGIDNLLHYLKQLQKEQKEPTGAEGKGRSRREMVRNLASLPLLGFLSWGGLLQHKKYDADVTSGATIQLKHTSLNELKGKLPMGKLGDHEISRLVLGGNLIGGWAHARDLIYVSSLFKAYNTQKKIFETLALAEQAGINAINIGFPTNAVLAKYKKIFGSNIKVISQVAPNMESGDYFEEINKALDYGADIIQVIGNWCDWLVRDHKTEVIAKMLDYIRSQGYTAGLGAHTVDSLITLKQEGIVPDYYMKTMHHDKYWSAHPIENRVAYEVDGKNYIEHDKFHNNIFCLFPERSVEFVAATDIPVMGYKVLAAGAIEPKDGFRWAFEKGADFICVGMFDFQVVDNVNTTLDILADLPARTRKWYG